MPTTPETWLTEFFVANNPGAQFEPQITVLTDGRILVAWEDGTNNTDTSPGSDIIGQLFDPLGNPDGSPFQINTTTPNEEDEFEIAAMPGGGWIIAYESSFLDASFLLRNPIVVEEFDSTGALVQTESFSEPSGQTFNDPAVAVNSAGDVVVAWNVDNNSGVTAVFNAFYDNSADTWTAPQLRLESSNEPSQIIQNHSVAALSDDSFIVVANRESNTVEDMIGVKIDSDGAEGSNSFFIIADLSFAINHSHVDAAALNGGGFVVVWAEDDGTDTDAYFSTYDTSNTRTTNRAGIATADTTDNKTQLSVTALTDGGFVIVWDDEATNEIRGQRYNSGGFEVGDEFLVTDSGTESQPEVIGLQDGRFAVTWQTSDGTGVESVEMKIFDIRDTVGTPVYTPDRLQIGTIGDDVFTVTGDGAFGHDGNDTITGSSSRDTIFGGAGDDSIDGANGADTINGGDGNDTIRGGSFSDFMDGGDDIDTLLVDEFNGVFEINLVTGETNFVETAVNFENVTTGNGDDTITGTDDANLIIVNGGTDSVDGGAGNDTVFGGADNDTINGGEGDDSIDGGSGSDSINGGDGNDTIRGGSSSDDMDGGDDIDTLLVDEFNGVFEINMVTGETNFVETAVNFENVTTGNGDDSITGTGGANLIIVNGGDDSIDGGAGNDTIDGGADDDTINGGAGDDTLTGGSGDDIFVKRSGESDDTILDFEKGADASLGDKIDVSDYGLAYVSLVFEQEAGGLRVRIGSDSILLAGSTLTQLDETDFNGLTANAAPTSIALSNASVQENVAAGTIVGALSVIDPDVGDAHALALIGDAGGLFALNGGNLVVSGALDFETNASHSVTVRATDLAGNSFDKVLTIGVIDVDDPTSGDDVLVGTRGADKINALGGNDKVSGLAGKDILKGGSGNDKLLGGGGKDTLKGGGGNDKLKGGGGNDKLKGGGGADNLKGQSGKDTLKGGGGNDVLKGGGGKDKLDGGGGTNKLTGNGGADTFLFKAGKTTITDYKSADKIDLKGAAGRADLDAVATVSGGDLVLEFSSKNVLTIKGVTDLDDLNFI